MKKLTIKEFNEIRSWIYRNARAVELSLWQYEFENGNPDAVVSALSFYQNPDGGFGNALEADSWNPNSSPVTTQTAIGKLEDIGFNDTSHPIIQGIIKFLESGVHSNDNGWLFNIPSNDNFPHAPWWTYNPQANEYESIGVTADLVCFILKFAGKATELYKRAFSLVDKLIDILRKPGNYGNMGVAGYCQLLDTINKLGIENKFDTVFLATILKKLVNESIVRDISKWINHEKRPSNFIRFPNSQYYEGNEDILEQELDYLIETRLENGVWGITWTWFQNNEKYIKEFAISENWWKAFHAIEKVKFLRNFGRIEK